MFLFSDGKQLASYFKIISYITLVIIVFWVITAILIFVGISKVSPVLFKNWDWLSVMNILQFKFLQMSRLFGLYINVKELNQYFCYQIICMMSVLSEYSWIPHAMDCDDVYRGCFQHSWSPTKVGKHQ